MKYLSTSLLHTAWTEDEKKQLDDAIALVETYEGTEFLKVISVFLYHAIEVDYILIGVEIKPTQSISTKIFLNKGRVITNFSYPLAGSPCANIIGNDLCYFPAGVQSIFPENQLLKNLAVESYIGLPLYDTEENNLGLISCMHRTIIERGGFVEALLNAISPRIKGN